MSYELSKIRAVNGAHTFHYQHQEFHKCKKVYDKFANMKLFGLRSWKSADCGYVTYDNAVAKKIIERSSEKLLTKNVRTISGSQFFSLRVSSDCLKDTSKDLYITMCFNDRNFPHIYYNFVIEQGCGMFFDAERAYRSMKVSRYTNYSIKESVSLEDFISLLNTKGFKSLIFNIDVFKNHIK